MRRADRLFQIVTILRSRRGATTARIIAEQLEVSERTIYRDIQALMVSGVPIESEAGVGYRLMRGFTLPPLNFQEDELEALLLGMRMVQAWSDRAMGRAATHALQKILAELPSHLKRMGEQTQIYSPQFFVDAKTAQFGEELRAAIRQKTLIWVRYKRVDGVESERWLEPLGMFFWGRTWTLVAWCRLRKEYREFRLDRLLELRAAQETFETQKDKCLDHYLDRVTSLYNEYFQEHSRTDQPNPNE
ncbi:WYL domain-containing protein [Hahella sp. KA22]|uniref:helix-turn-helix transcriptional regulator n=1 Tax=Hahella sp. KA22 TaxID=1628392 RepID=UPI000FDDD002|nr:YafY family protein [Hahella sp. KA22]AZZ89814.1 YafY family transcriptional regulator [Hahella sp. KA22]QAY53184.1 WYL domain-containing protein [Hahella sp. KA22]